MLSGIGPIRFAALMSLTLALVGCPARTQPPVPTPTKSPPPAVAERPKEMKGTPDTTKVRVQKVKNFLFREKATGKFLEPGLAQAFKPEDVLLEPGDFEELLFQKDRVRYAFYARETDAQPYVVEREWKAADWQAFDASLDADGMWGLKKKDNWDEKTRFPFYYIAYAVGDFAFEASFTPTLQKLKTAGPVIDGMIDSMGGNTPKLTPGTVEMSFAQQAADGQVRVAVSEVKADASGDPIEKPFNLQSAVVDTGKEKIEAIIGPIESGFIFEQPRNGGQFMTVSVKLTSEDNKTYSTLLPIRSRK